MGQYYKFIILGDEKHRGKEIIVLVVNPHDFMKGAKLMEHCYHNNILLNTVEFLIGPNGQYHKARCVWAGDYAIKDKGDNENLYRLADNYTTFRDGYKHQKFNYIVNHTKKLYVDTNKRNNDIHPLPLLICEGNGNGSGDYDGNDDHLVGSWARNVVSMEYDIPVGYSELKCNFYEY